MPGPGKHGASNVAGGSIVCGHHGRPHQGSVGVLAARLGSTLGNRPRPHLVVTLERQLAVILKIRQKPRCETWIVVRKETSLADLAWSLRWNDNLHLWG